MDKTERNPFTSHELTMKGICRQPTAVRTGVVTLIAAFNLNSKFVL